MSGLSGTGYLVKARELVPDAKRSQPGLHALEVHGATRSDLDLPSGSLLASVFVRYYD